MDMLKVKNMMRHDASTLRQYELSLTTFSCASLSVLHSCFVVFITVTTVHKKIVACLK